MIRGCLAQYFYSMNGRIQCSQLSIFVSFSFSSSVSQPSIKTLPPPTLLDLPYQQQTMGAVSLVDQDTWVFIPSLQQLQNINRGTSNSPPISHYWWSQKHSYYNNINTGLAKSVGQKFQQLILFYFFPQYAVNYFPNATIHGHIWVMMSIAIKNRIQRKKGK